MVEQEDVVREEHSKKKEERIKFIANELYDKLGSLLLQYPEFDGLAIVCGWTEEAISSTTRQTHAVIRVRPEHEVSLENLVVLERLAYQSSMVAAQLASIAITSSKHLIALCHDTVGKLQKSASAESAE